MNFGNKTLIGGIPEKLAPCPFCGGRSTLISVHDESDNVYIKCMRCECRGPVERKNGIYDAATELWNRRELPPDQD